MPLAPVPVPPPVIVTLTGPTSPAAWSFEWWVDVAQIVGAIGTVIALIVAFRALISARRDLINEQRTAHELEILRALSEVLLGREEEHIKLFRCQLYLSLIPESEDMPLTRAAIGVRPTEDAVRDFAREFPGVPELPTTGSKEAAATERFGQLLLKGAWHREEVRIAIARRLTPPSRWWTRALGWMRQVSSRNADRTRVG